MGVNGDHPFEQVGLGQHDAADNGEQDKAMADGEAKQV
jgi:hypothetical protein